MRMERNERDGHLGCWKQRPRPRTMNVDKKPEVSPSMLTGGNGNSGEETPAVGKKITSCRDSKLVREIHHCVSKDENSHSVDCEYAAVINDSMRSVLLSRFLN